jgi:hypothetical protein
MNAQTACEEMDLNNGLFNINDSCGYLLKPKWMREGNTIVELIYSRLIMFFHLGTLTAFSDLSKRELKMILKLQVSINICLSE